MLWILDIYFVNSRMTTEVILDYIFINICLTFNTVDPGSGPRMTTAGVDPESGPRMTTAGVDPGSESRMSMAEVDPRPSPD